MNRSTRLLEEWLASITSDNSRHTYRAYIERYAAWCEANEVQPINCGYAMLNAYYESLRPTRTERALYQTQHALTKYYDFAVARGEINENPARHDRALRFRNRRRSTVARGLADTLDIDEVLALFEAAAARPPRYLAALGLLGVNALKVGELIALDVGDLSTREGRPCLELRSRSIGKWTPLVEPTVGAINALTSERSSGEPLFTRKDGGRATATTIRQWLRSLANDAESSRSPRPPNCETRPLGSLRTKG